ncbi:MAG: hypothetical protein GWO86_02475 [Planctomycetes bacterium]|nr:hypothetical protein [Planctomycetota bacterium]
MTKMVKIKSPAGKNQPQQLAQKDYQLITERILGLSKKLKSILFAGSDPGALPITIPVNVAIQLAEKGKSCLLIDLDLKRDALAQVFEISDEQINQYLIPRAMTTNFPNLFIWPARHFIRTRLMNIAEIVDAAVKNMDIVLVNAPAVRASLDRSQILAACRVCCIFSNKESASEEMFRLAKSSGCVLIGNIQLTTHHQPLPNNTSAVHCHSSVSGNPA